MTNRVYDFTLGAVLGASQRFDVGGAYIKILSAPGGSVGVKLDSGPVIALLAGQGVRLPEGTSFRDVTLSNLQAVANAGTLFIGDAGFEDSRVVGDVSIIDNSAAKTRLATQFWGTAAKAAVAAQFASVNLQPSGGVVALKALAISSSTAQLVQIGRTTSAGTTNPLGGSGPANKYFANAAAIIGRTSSGFCAAATPTGAELPGFVSFGNFNVPAGQLVSLPLTTPMVLEGANGLYVLAQTANTDLSALFDLEVIS